MPTITADEARDTFASLISRIAGDKESYVVADQGKNLVAIIPMEEFHLLRKVEDYIDVQMAMQALEDPESIPWEQLKADLGL